MNRCLTASSIIAAVTTIPAAALAQPAEEPPLVVIVESADDSIIAAEVRAALASRLHRAVVALAMPAATDARALLSVAVDAEGAAYLLAVDIDGTQLRARTQRPADATSADWLVDAGQELVQSLTGDRATRLALRAGLVPWDTNTDTEAMQQASTQAVSALTLLPWPDRSPRAFGGVRPASAERADGLSAPPTSGRRL